MIEWDNAERSYSVVSAEKGSKDGEVERRYRMYVKPGGFHVLQSDNSVLSKSDQYAFALIRDKPEQEWRMTWYQKTGGGKEDAPSIGSKANLFRPLSAFGHKDRIDDLMSDPSFVITGVKPAAGSNLQLVFRRQITTAQGKSGTITGEMTVDPARSWVVTESKRRSTLAPGFEFHVRREFDPSVAGPRPRCVLYESLAKASDTQSTDTLLRHRFSDYSDGPVDPDVFRLKTYGLPEPVDVVPPPTRTPPYVWALLAAACCGAAALLFRYFATRRSPRGGTPA